MCAIVRTTNEKGTQPMGTYTGEVGCIFDGHRGHYIYPAIVELAIHYGMPVTEAESLTLANYGADTESVDFVEWADEAERWLNDNVAWPEHSFGWNDGEYYYCPNEWWQEV
jgi:hypothetical protein